MAMGMETHYIKVEVEEERLAVLMPFSVAVKSLQLLRPKLDRNPMERVALVAPISVPRMPPTPTILQIMIRRVTLKM